jgi:hypothetical protein
VKKQNQLIKIENSSARQFILMMPFIQSGILSLICLVYAIGVVIGGNTDKAIIPLVGCLLSLIISFRKLERFMK